jgi:cardiolipin synthase
MLVEGDITDAKSVKYAGRAHYKQFMEQGIEIYEYQPAMMHAKVLVVDGEWAVLGTTNMDNRSFEHNDEVNLAMRDRDVGSRLLADYERDLLHSTEMTLARWNRRPLWEKIVGPFVWILERQQ